MKTLCIISGALTGFSVTLLGLWELTMMNAAAVIFWSIIASLFGALFFGAYAEELQRKERQKRRIKRKFQTYKVER